ncbi:Hsp20/alpha crystallin family protein [Aliiroseovarius subalbicans]|uniref:Hsp20/alpha crystallin family protein n=1 Tax=Aliiroseovarius subalbicans TaxID=2925840 RepID=UPI001F565539|nr:Hsp20/alpha crystallin family protein [Aliiroseovarius subalbicans]MCI2399341.1 Hsp20/alpha crystallin family protein [Aliiroseovarius subalbicans]
MVEKTNTTNFWPSLQEPFRTMGSRLAEFLTPASEASLADDAYRIAIELPGVSDEDIALSVHEGVVQVKGEKKTEREEKGDTWYFSERQYGSFSRSFRLPPDADEAKVQADMKDGVLTITVPKSEPKAAKATQVKINKA